MTRNFRAAFNELLFSDIPQYLSFGIKLIVEFTAPGRHFLISKALTFTLLSWFLLVLFSIETFQLGGRNPLLPSDWIRTENAATDFRDYLWAWSFPLGALLVSLTLVNALRRTRIQEAELLLKNQETDSNSYIEATKLLSSADIFQRLAGIHALEATMRSDFTRAQIHHKEPLIGIQAGQTLASFIRWRSSEVRAVEVQGDLLRRDNHGSNSIKDIEYAFNALVSQWLHAYRQTKGVDQIDLTGCFLKSAYIVRGADLRTINLCKSDFSGVFLAGVLLDHTNLLLWADFSNSMLEGALFKHCDISHVKFDDCDIKFSQIGTCRWRKGEAPSLPEELLATFGAINSIPGARRALREIR